MAWNDERDEGASQEPEQEEEIAQGEEMEPSDEVSSEDIDESVAETPELEVGEGDEVPEGIREKREPSKLARFFRKALIWLVVIAVAFGGGIITFHFLRFQPLQETVKQQRGALQEAEEEISSLESEVERLATFEERNQELVDEIEDVRLHINILSARASVSKALLALSEENIAEAKLALDKVGGILADLEGMLNEDQVEVVENMQQRHGLIMEELEEDTFSARSDLEVLSSKLESLENTLFASP